MGKPIMDATTYLRFIARRIFNDLGDAWIEQPNQELDGRVPLDVIAEGDPDRINELLHKINGDGLHVLRQKAYTVMSFEEGTKWLNQPHPELANKSPEESHADGWGFYREAEWLLTLKAAETGLIPQPDARRRPSSMDAS